MFASMSHLQESAVNLTSKTLIMNSINGKIDKLSHGWITQGYRKKYALEEGIISFIDEFGKWYIIPNVEGVVETLRNHGYRLANFAVPCDTQYIYPIQDKRKWDMLLSIKRV